MPCSVCEYYFLQNRKSPCGCSYGEHQKTLNEKPKPIQNNDYNNSHYCAVCKIKVSGSLLDCMKQPMCNGCYYCCIVDGHCTSCN